jgi:O-antigen/teichoic acid export membrane protein
MPTISKNIFWSTIAAGLQIYTGGIVFILMARMMSIDNFGLLSFGFSLGTLLSTCLDFGQSLMIMKDYLQEKFDTNRYVLNSMAQKVLLILIFCPAFLLYLFAFYDDQWLYIGALFIIFAIITAFVLYLQAILRVQNRFRNSTYSVGVYAFCITLVVGWYYLGRFTTVQFVALMIISKFIQLIVSAYMCREIFRKNWFSLPIQKYILKNSWSFGAHFIFGTFYFTIDTQIIALLLEARDVALYQAVFRIIYIFLIVSDIASNVLLPYLSSKYALKENIGRLSANILYFLLVVGSGLFLAFTSFHKEIITILYTDEYAQAFILVIPLSLVILLRTSASIYGSLLTISNNQINRVKVVFVSMMLSIALNFIFIPVAGILAAAWVSVIVHLALWLGYFIYSKRDFPDINLLTRENVKVLAITAIIFLLSTILFGGNTLLNIGLCAGWVLLILYGMKKNGKDEILKDILQDKGVI